MLKILHVTQCYDGGVSRAMDNISKLLPDLKHYVIYSGTEDPEESGHYSGVRQFSRNPLKRMLEVRAFAKELGVELVHAHSSWAGLYTRVLRLPVPVVYEPHCFVFDDPERHPFLRSIYRKIEGALSRRTSITVALTGHERRLAKSIDQNATVHILPNIPTIPTVLDRESPSQERPVITMIGRIAPQKDPQFFLDLAQACGDQGLPFRFVWIGAGDEEASDSLVAAGVEVTGWLSPSEISTRLDSTWVYFHSALYEGFPLSVLDAAAARVPIVVRDLPCFDETKLTRVDGLAAAVSTLSKAYSDRDYFESTKAGGEHLLRTMNEETHAEALRSVYREARNTTEMNLVGSRS